MACIAVRFGNVLGARGASSRSQGPDRAGGPVTVTHPDAVRWFMTVPEAVSLVLQAASIGGSGEIFFLDMGSRCASRTWRATSSRWPATSPTRRSRSSTPASGRGEARREVDLLQRVGPPTSHPKIFRVVDPRPADIAFLKEVRGVRDTWRSGTPLPGRS